MLITKRATSHAHRIQLETGFNSAIDGLGEETSEPIFQLGRVQYAFPAPLALLSVSSNILTMCLYSYPHSGTLPQNLPPPPRLVRINLDDPERTEEAEIPSPPLPRNRAALPTDPSLLGPHKLFADPTGKHLVLSMRSGDNYYWRSGWKKARPLNKWKGIVVESIGWNKDAANAPSKRNAVPAFVSTREILVGSKDGNIFEAVIVAPTGDDGDEGDFLDRLARRTAGAGGGGSDLDRVFRRIFILPDRQPVTGLIVNRFTSASSDSRAKASVIATTTTRIYEFIGGLSSGRSDDGESASVFGKLFEPYKGSVPSLKSELPAGDSSHSELRSWAQSETKSPKALAWLTGAGLYHGLLSYAKQDTGDSVIDSANLLPFPSFGDDRSIPEVPSSVMLSEFHFMLLYHDRVAGINSLDDRVVFEETLPLKARERVIGSSVDISRQTYWVYTDASIFEVVVRNEDRDIWRVHLERGAHESALKYVKTSAQRDLVLSAQGDRFFSEGRHIQAAQCYAQSFARTFEEIVLRFLDAEATDALRYYLITRLERLKKSDITQRTMLSTWLVEIYLSKLDELEDIAAAQAASQDVENYRLEQGLIDEELRQFLITYTEDLDERTTFSLISRHGRTDLMLHYAAVVGQHERIVRHWIDARDWTRAIEALNAQPSLRLYYRFSTILMRHAPEATVNSWMRRDDLDPRKLIPAMLQHKAVKDQVNQATRYLYHLIEELENTDPAIHNFLFAILAKGPTRSSAEKDDSSVEADLLHFIANSPTDPITGAPHYDLDYALRTCAENKRQEASIRIYAKMGFYENAVTLALSNGDVPLACQCADMAEQDESLRRKLWLKTAQYVVETEKDIASATEFLSLTPLLSIEDILPFFPDFTVIDSFKGEICLALEGYADRIESLKKEMEQATDNANHIRQEIDKLNSRFVTIEQDEKCGICRVEVRKRRFYVFPCRHSFHADCLIQDTTRRLSPRVLRRLLELQTQLSQVTSGLIPPLPTGLTNNGSSNESATSAQTAVNNLSLTRRTAAMGAAAVSGVGLDRLPEALISVLSAGVSVSVASGRKVLAPLDPFSQSQTYQTRVATDPNGGTGGGTEEKEQEKQTRLILESRRQREQVEEVERLREEMDEIIAGACPLCEGSLSDLAKGFVSSGGAGGVVRREELQEEEEWAL